MGTNHRSVIVIGAGIAGASCAYHLTRAGVDDVVIVERDQPASKASGRAAGFLTPYQFFAAGSHHDANAYCRDVFEEMTATSDLDLHYRDAYTLARTQHGVERLERLHDETPIESELLSPDVLADRVPISTDDVRLAFAFENGAYTDPHRATMAFLDAALDAGADLRTERVLEVVTEGGSVSGIHTTDGTRYASSVVVAAGAWSKQLAATADVSVLLKPRISQIAMVRPPEPIDLPLVNDPDLSLYYRTELDDDVLIGGGTGTQELDPDAFSTDARESFLREVADTAHRIAPEFADATVVNAWAGRCSATPDRHPLVGPTAVDGLYLCCGFNGEGIMHSPAAGRTITDVITGRDSPFDRVPFAPDRFRGRETDDFEIKSAIDW